MMSNPNRHTPADPTAARANEASYRLGPVDYSVAFEVAEFEAEQEAEDVDAMTTEQCQAVNAEMARWFGIE